MIMVGKVFIPTTPVLLSPSTADLPKWALLFLLVFYSGFALWLGYMIWKDRQ